MIDQIAIWMFPAADFAAWRELVGSAEVTTHAEYVDLIAAVQADQERQGRRVVRKLFTVAEMKQELASRGWANTPDNRAAVTALRA